MGQKINPISLRLDSTNRYFDDCWYSDYFYSYLLSQDIKTRLYLNCILKQINYPSARFYIQSFQKKTKIFVFFCSPIESREIRSKLFNLKQYNLIKKTISNKISNNKYKGTIKQRRKQNLSYNFKKINKTKKAKTGPLPLDSISPGFTQILRHRRQAQKTKGEKKQILPNQIAKKIYFRYFLLHNFLLKNIFSNKTNQSISKKENSTHGYPAWQRFSTLNSLWGTVPMPTIFFSGLLRKKLKKFQNYKQIISVLRKKNKKLFQNNNTYFSKGRLLPRKTPTTNRFHNSPSFSINNNKILPNRSKSLQLIQSIQHKVNPLASSNSVIIGDQFLNFFLLSNNITYRNHFELTLYKQLGLDFNLYPIKVYNDYRSALFLAEEIVHYIQRRVPFRRIKNRILKEVTFYSQVKGLRIACSGRVGGRSKKAQKAKTVCFKYGQTSLHVFSSYIDFASKTALTPFGSVGVKVWICFK